MTEGVLKNNNGSGFPVAPPKKLKINDGQYGSFASIILSSGYKAQGNPLPSGGHIEYAGANINYKDTNGNLVWASGLSGVYFHSAGFFHTFNGVEYIYFVGRGTVSPWNTTVVRVALSDGAVTNGNLNDNLNGFIFFTSAAGLHCYSGTTGNGEVVYDVNYDTLALVVNANQSDFLSSLLGIRMYPTFDLTCAFKDVTSRAQTGSTTAYMGEKFRGAAKVKGVGHSVTLHIPTTAGMPVTFESSGFEEGMVTQISDDVVMSFRPDTGDEDAFKYNSNIHSSPSYFDKTDFDRWIKEMIGVAAIL